MYTSLVSTLTRQNLKRQESLESLVIGESSLYSFLCRGNFDRLVKISGNNEAVP